ncbi:hypothetical protein NFI96_005339 [Prochilodus magdalenae]|nr:hypothetical protein NFI96_005339 [Prochilodus magdalenae]
MASMVEIPMPYSCHRRSLYITEDWSCVIAFLKCCSEYWGQALGDLTKPSPTPPSDGYVLYDIPEHIPIQPGRRQFLQGRLPGLPGFDRYMFHMELERGGAGMMAEVSGKGKRRGRFEFMMDGQGATFLEKWLKQGSTP